MAESTTVRNLPDCTIRKCRLLAAALTHETGENVSMNSLYARAIEEFIERPENKERVRSLKL